jgi:hypothetical protein
VLNREPTNSELRRYKGLMEDERWTEADVRRDISSRSDYYRYSTNRGMRPEAIIRRALSGHPGARPRRGGDAHVSLEHRRARLDGAGRPRGPAQQPRIPDRPSPHRVRGPHHHRAYQDILGRQPDPEGLNTYRRNIIERGWDEQDVRTALRRSQERHDIARSSQRSVSDAEASEMVRRPYQTGPEAREPDASGMQEYKARILNDRWTEQQVVSALRSSPRGARWRGPSAPSATARPRRWSAAPTSRSLNREPDAGGPAGLQGSGHERSSWTSSSS